MNDDGAPGRDALAAFSFLDAPVRGAIVRLDGAWASIARTHHPRIAQLLGEMLCGSALLAHLLKDTDVALQTRGDGPLHTVVTECFDGASLRGVARTRADVLADAQSDSRTARAGTDPLDGVVTSRFASDEVADIESLLGEGRLAITLRPPVGEAHQGIVPLQGASMSGCIEFYFRTSEQLPTRLWLTARDGIAAGLLLQRVPVPPEASEMTEARALALWDEVALLASTLTAEELRSAPLARLLPAVFPQHRIRLRPEVGYSARCTCTRERSLGALRLLGRDEVDATLAERGQIEMHCQFCGADYLFSRSELDDLWQA